VLTICVALRQLRPLRIVFFCVVYVCYVAWQLDFKQKRKQEAQLSLGLPTVLIVSYFQGYRRSMIFISSKKAYTIAYQ